MGFWYGMGAAHAPDTGTTSDRATRNAQKQVGIRPTALGGNLALTSFQMERGLEGLFDDQLNFGDERIIVPARGVYRQPSDVHGPAIAQEFQ